MKTIVAGGTGFIGEALARELLGLGEVVVLSRDPAKVRIGRGVAWGAARGAWEGELAGATAVVNLAGENIGEGRWTDERKRRLLSSRIEATRALTAAMASHPAEGRTFVSASAIGVYGDRGDEVLAEDAAPGTGVLADICLQWEAAAREASASARVIIPRFGIVLGRDGGALPKMATPVRFFAGGRIGSGRQWMSWVDLADVVRFIRWALEGKDAAGVYNLTAPNPVTNEELIATLASVMRRPAVVPAPAAALRLLLGEAAEELLLASQRVVPRRAEAEGFRFEYREVGASLRRIYGEG
ncbi:MAG TPA: TIGR01777 family oxidoreductase [Thermoanaerobaculia bacterium]|nr:TIGR01777 family oxidoreductase [Thermoanaerobaculia bacterium]